MVEQVTWRTSFSTLDYSSFPLDFFQAGFLMPPGSLVLGRWSGCWCFFSFILIPSIKKKSFCIGGTCYIPVAGFFIYACISQSLGSGEWILQWLLLRNWINSNLVLKCISYLKVKIVPAIMLSFFRRINFRNFYSLDLVCFLFWCEGYAEGHLLCLIVDDN